jgi:hypothetical protein
MMDRLIRGATLALVLSALTPLMTNASATREHHATGVAHSVSTTFRLHVLGAPDRRTTFWVAYGPLAGEWGVIRLSRVGAGIYGATRALPSSGRTTFSYLAGQGTVKSRLGPTPGGRVVIIQKVGPVSAAQLSGYSVDWRAPVG